MCYYLQSPLVSLTLLVLVTVSVKSETGNFTITNNQEKEYEADITVHITSDVCPEGWQMTLHFPKPVENVEVWDGIPKRKTRRLFVIKNKDYNSVQMANTVLKIKVKVSKKRIKKKALKAKVTFERISKKFTPPPIIRPPGSTMGRFRISSSITWKQGFTATVEFPKLHRDTLGWEVIIAFSRPIRRLIAHNGEVRLQLVKRFKYKIGPKTWNNDLGCKPFTLQLQAEKSGKICNPGAVVYINAPADDGSCPVSTAPPTNPVTTVPPVPTTNAPGTTVPPVPSTEPPVPSTEPPVPSTEPPVPSTEPPVPSTEPPVTSTEPPVPSTEPPVTSTEAPVPSTKPPVPSTEPPVPSTVPPVPSTEPPVPSTEPPVPSTSAAGTTEPPVPSTEPPVPSTNAPSTSSPNLSTRLPTSSPDECTEEPSSQQPSITTVPPATQITQPPSGAYDYKDVLHKSILFYEAQRSGKLPTNNRVSWRKDSALNDLGDNGEDLTGGWYDAGDYVKFGFPMASSATVLAWGLVEYRDSYERAGELNNMLDSIKWATDYFIKAHTAKYEFYGQVGNGKLDHAYWGRPEDMTMPRPAYKITKAKPGSDLAAETAAALAAASIAFKATDSSYADTLVRHARELYDFADKYRGKYSDSITDARDFYNSHNGYSDELVWGAVWLYRATWENAYLTKAEKYYSQFGLSSKPWSFSWDEKTPGVQLLLAKITGKDSYKKDVQNFLSSWLPGGDVTYTPRGLAWRAQWAPNRYSANVAFLALVAADLGLNPLEYRSFARFQIHYMLGDSGRSYVVGFGTNPPLRPHHASSSCPLAPSPCGWNDLHKPGPNPQTLYGALVGGPDQYDHYEDKRNDYIKNEVTTDYNAGFQSAVAGLMHLA